LPRWREERLDHQLGDGDIDWVPKVDVMLRKANSAAPCRIGSGTTTSPGPGRHRDRVDYLGGKAANPREAVRGLME
jgi:hypothetical protein